MADSKFQIEGVDPEAPALLGTRGDEEGVLRPVREGQPIQGEIVTIKDITRDGVCTLETVYTHKGPSRASTKAYRRGYDQVFGSKKTELN